MGNWISDKKMDTDDPEHIGWLYSIAAARAKEFKIEGVTWALTQGVVKNIIPAIASTNAIIAGFPFHPGPYSSRSCFFSEASCCNEAFKIATSSAAYLNNYFMLIGTDGVYSYTFEHERRPECPVCGGESVEISISRDYTVDKLIDMLVEKQNMCVALPSQWVTVLDTCLLKNPARSRSPLFRHPRNRFTSKRPLSSKKPHVRISTRRFPNSWQTVER